MEKNLKFKHDFVKEILEGRKVSTWRLFDDKNLTLGDILKLVDQETLDIFGRAKIIDLKVKKISELTSEELNNHGYLDIHSMIESHKKYYGDKVNLDTEVKILNFKLI